MSDREWQRQYSPDRRFLLLRRDECTAGVDHARVELRLAAGEPLLLAMGAPGCRIDTCCFDVNGRALLHIRLSREDGSLLAYPATLDLDSGLYYHGDPRQAQAAVGQAADLERIAAGGALPRADQPIGAPRWPLAAELAPPAQPADAQAAITPVPAEALAAAPAGMSPPHDEQLSPDGHWRLVCQPHARIVDTHTAEAVLDLAGTSWDCEGRMNPSANQLWLTIRDATDAPYLHVFIDLDCLLWWETDPAGAFRSDGRLMAPLAELQQLLSRHVLPERRLRLVATPRDPPPAAARTLWSSDKHYRVELQPSGRSEFNARGEARPLYHVRVLLHFRGRELIDTRHTGHEAWLPDEDGKRFEVATPAEFARGEFLLVDAWHGTCWRENVRGPTSAEHPLSRIGELLD